MQESDLFIKLMLSVVFGAVLGLETETREIEDKGKTQAKKEEKYRLGGLRTYTLISLFGGIAGIFYVYDYHILTYILFSAIIVFMLLAYFLNVKMHQAFGMTTEIAVILGFTLGFLTTSGLVRFEILLAILLLMAFFLSQKRGIGNIIEKINHREVIDMIKFGLVALLLLPILPNQSYYLSDLTNFLGLPPLNNENLNSIYIINPFSMWLIVVLISGINLLVYYLSRLFGTKRGILLVGLFGGFFSSTSTLISLAAKSKHTKDKILIKKYAGGAILATGISFLLAGILFAVTNFELFVFVLPLLLSMFITGIIVGTYLITRKDGESSENVHEIEYETFSLGPALKFVGLIILITLVIQIMQNLNINESLIILFTGISGLLGIDAPIIAISNLTSTGSITLVAALAAFLFTNTTNLIGKSIYSRTLGSAIFFKYTSIGLLIVALAGFASLIFIL